MKPNPSGKPLTVIVGRYIRHYNRIWPFFHLQLFDTRYNRVFLKELDYRSPQSSLFLTYVLAFVRYFLLFILFNFCHCHLSILKGHYPTVIYFMQLVGHTWSETTWGNITRLGNKTCQTCVDLHPPNLAGGTCWTWQIGLAGGTDLHLPAGSH